ncbi:MAG: allantoinase PuuE [SAR202 cluster bacterium]|jgi:allantoinase|nr:MAG: allantoinase PuuE [SAR202 cluster bacterium]MCH2526860.1 allantoinase PuuE [Dehalococcoidia bacterium]
MENRDFIGYGENPPNIVWPNKAKIAISVVVNYEEGSEYSLLDGDTHHETNNEVPSPVPLNQRDLFNESFFEYGSRVGVWRLLNLFERYGVKTTFYCCAVALERNPEVARAIVERGHEVCGHGYRWQEYHSMDRDSELDSIRRTVESLERTTGVRPVGWFTRYGPSLNTRELVAGEEGFIYDSCSMNDDLPYFVRVNEAPWLVVPYSFETNDARFWRGGLVSVNDFFEYLKDTFDCLYEEGQSFPKMMSVGLHCRITGRPARSRAVQRFLEYASGFPDVWFARRDEIASHWLSNYNGS